MANFIARYRCDCNISLRLVNLCLTYILSVLLVSFVYLPFRHNASSAPTVSNEDNAITKQNESDVAFAYEEDDNFSFNIIFYIGLSTGSLLGGITSYFISPGKSAAFFSKLTCLACLIAANTMDKTSDDAMGVSASKWAWFCLCTFALAGYLSTYVHTLQSVPGPWLVLVSLGLLGVHWPTASFYSIVLVIRVDTWYVRLFLHGVVMLMVITLQDLMYMPNNINYKKVKKETLADLIKNSLGVRYLLCLSFLWLLHGYTYYGSYHEIYGDKTATPQAFKCAVSFVFKLLFAGLCYWTRQQRPVMAVLLFLNALSCFALVTFHTMATEEDIRLVGITMQIVSFLISCSWCILWAMTVQTYGSGVRCLVTGFCSGLARLSSLLGSLAVAHDAYRDYPSAISGTLFLIASVVVFLLPEPNMTCLTTSMRKPKQDKKEVVQVAYANTSV